MAVFPSTPPLSSRASPSSPSQLTHRRALKSKSLSPPSPSLTPSSSSALSSEAALLHTLEAKLTHPPPTPSPSSPPSSTTSSPSPPTATTLSSRLSTLLLALTARLFASLFPSVQYVALPSDHRPPPTSPTLIHLYGHSYDISRFAQHHPGGSVILQSVIGTDCTDTFAGNHPKLLVQQAREVGEGQEVRGLLKSMWRGPVAVAKEGVMGGTEKGELGEREGEREVRKVERSLMQQDWDRIVMRLEAEGKFNSTMGFYVGKALVQLLLFAAVLACLALAHRHAAVPTASPALTSCLTAPAVNSSSSWSPLSSSAALLTPSAPPSLLSLLLAFLTPTLSFLYLSLSAFLLGLFWQQMAFLGHDAGHNQITGSARTDYPYAWCVCALFGVSGDWWKRNHNVHHVHTNSIECDPDIQHLPMLAVSEDILHGFWSSFYQKPFTFDGVARAMVRWQHWLYYPLMAIARANLYVQSWLLVLNPNVKVPHRRYELLALALFWAWYITLMQHVPGTLTAKLWYYLLSHAVAGLVHVQITLSHFAMPAYHGPTLPPHLPISSTTHATPSSSFSPSNPPSPPSHTALSHTPQPPPLYPPHSPDTFFYTQFSTTMNVSCPSYMDWFHGGLQFQVEHHLLPRLPRRHLREAMELHVRPFARRWGLPYHAYSFWQSNGLVIEQLRMQAMKAREMEKEGEGGQEGGKVKSGEEESVLWQGMMARG